MKTIGHVKAVDGVSFTSGSGRNHWPGRRIRLWQDHHGTPHPAPGATHQWPRVARRPGHSRACRGRHCRPTVRPCRRYSRIPGRRSIRACRWARSLRVLAACSNGGSALPVVPHGWRSCSSRWGCIRSMPSVSARVQRWPAAAHRPGWRAGVTSQADRVGRTGVGARRVDPRPDHESPQRHPGANARRLCTGRPSSGHRALYGAPDGGHVPGTDRRVCADRRALRIRCIPTPRRCLPPRCRRIPTSDKIVLSGEVPSPINPPRDVASTRAAPSRWPSAPASIRSRSSSRPITWSPATFTEHRG